MCACAVRRAQTKLYVEVSTRTETTPEHARIDLSNATVLTGDTEAHAYRALVAHVCGPASCPLRLDIDRLPPYAVVPPVHEKRDADVHNLRNECVSLVVWCMLLDLRENERVAVLDDALGPPSHCNSQLNKPRELNALMAWGLTAKMEREQLLEANRDNVRCARLVCEERRHLEGRGKPVDEVLR